MSMILAYGNNMDEVYKSYMEQVNNMIFIFLEQLGYEVERTNQGASKLMKQIKNEKKQLNILETNRKLVVDKGKITYSCDVEVELVRRDKSGKIKKVN